MLLGVQVDATGPFLNGHYREAHVNAAVKFPFLDLRQDDKKYPILCYYHIRKPQKTNLLFIINSAKEVMWHFICLLFVRTKTK